MWTTVYCEIPFLIDISVLGKNIQNFNKVLFNLFYSVSETKSSTAPYKEENEIPFRSLSLASQAVGRVLMMFSPSFGPWYFRLGFTAVAKVEVPVEKDEFYTVCVVFFGDLFLLHRYIRFFPDGHVMMLTTPEEPQSIVPRLRTRNTRWCFPVTFVFYPSHISYECIG